MGGNPDQTKRDTDIVFFGNVGNADTFMGSVLNVYLEGGSIKGSNCVGGVERRRKA